MTAAPVVRFRALSIDAVDPAAVAGFWAAVLGREAQLAASGEAVLRPAADGGPEVHVHRVPEAKTVKDRIHLDVTLEPGQEIPDLLRLGATVVSEPDDVRWWVLADPEGNEFCAFLPESDASNDADAEIPAG